jgi:hypothetical protein
MKAVSGIVLVRFNIKFSPNTERSKSRSIKGRLRVPNVESRDYRTRVACRRRKKPQKPGIRGPFYGILHPEYIARIFHEGFFSFGLRPQNR